VRHPAGARDHPARLHVRQPRRRRRPQRAPDGTLSGEGVVFVSGCQVAQ